MQGIRLAKLQLGEIVVIYGLGLIGQLTARLAKANGCTVIGIDKDQERIDFALSQGVEGLVADDTIVNRVQDLTGGTGVDVVLITASAKNDSIIKNAAQMCRKRGRIILVGVVDLSIDRSDFYEKELNFQVSCSYGPGRYDTQYEENGVDYPYGYVRWTENRNFQAILSMLKSSSLHVKDLVNDRIPFENSLDMYQNIQRSKTLATLLIYSNPVSDETVIQESPNKGNAKNPVSLAIIGTGNYVRSTLLPIVRKTGAPIGYLCSLSGISASLMAKKYDVQKVTTKYESVLEDKDIGSVIIATRHDLHAKQCVQALISGKNVFVEKPVALTFEELMDIENTINETGNSSIIVGFNRRFSPYTQIMRDSIGGQLATIVITVNAGHLPIDHWTQDPGVGGGRIIGEGCHFIDLFTHFRQ